MYTTTSSRSTSKCAPKFVDDTHVLVTKEFAKKAMVFDSPEYKLWRRIKAERSDAEMVTNGHDFENNPSADNPEPQAEHDILAEDIEINNKPDTPNNERINISVGEG